jgi:hypothetical protein
MRLFRRSLIPKMDGCSRRHATMSLSGWVMAVGMTQLKEAGCSQVEWAVVGALAGDGNLEISIEG